MKIFYVPIEPYETRYTADWVKQFEAEFIENKVEFETILGTPTTTKLKPGTVLDACGTNIYKFSQLQKILYKINSGDITENDVIFFADMWFPGLESLFYVRDLEKVNFKVCGILHAGTWDPYDFTAQNNLQKWAKKIETSWINEVDRIFVATNFHKKLIEDYIRCSKNKIKVTGIPFYGKQLAKKYTSQKENIIVFPHRIVPEKNPKMFKELSNCPELSNFKFVKTLDVCKNRDEYFTLLGKAKYMVSFAQQETFGYSTVESMALGCKVIVPDALSYQETVPQEDRYNISDDWVNEVKTRIINNEKQYSLPNYEQCLLKWENSINLMIEEMKGL